MINYFKRAINQMDKKYHQYHTCYHNVLKETQSIKQYYLMNNLGS